MKKRTNVTLRHRVLPSGRTTLYLDYTSGGKRKSESLKLFLEPGTSRAVKEKNRETLKLAETILSKRKVAIQNNEFGFSHEYADETYFYEYFLQIANSKNNKRKKTWISCLAHIKNYDSKIETRTFDELDADWIKGLKQYLDKKAIAWGCSAIDRCKDYHMSQNTKMAYYAIVRACFNQACNDGIITRNPFNGIEGFKPEDTTRMYLTIDEVRTISKYECKYPVLKRAFLFSCLTGLRRSDIEKLTWGEVLQQGRFTRIIFKQKKTGGQEYLDISPQAAELLGQRHGDDECVFDNLPVPSVSNSSLRKWVSDAGIKKSISFHCGRHTFAVMMLDLGTDIYTVSKLLGHRELSTTQIYAKVLDKNKQAAVARIPDIINHVSKKHK